MAVDDAFEAWRRRAADANILEVAQGGDVKAKLTKKSREWVGACPLCGGGSDAKGKKRKADGFAVNPAKGIFNCRRGGVGGDVISMVMHTCSASFLQACEIITGEPPPERGSVITEETRRKTEELQAEAAERERRRREDENIYRSREIRTVRDIYKNAHPFAGSSAEIYAGIRGLVFPPVPADRAAPIKCVEAMPYHVDKDTIVHRGPAMVAPIINAAREFQGLHFTYLELEREKGKLQLEHEGDLLDAKKSRGSKQGNFIALSGPAAPTFLVLGEAIEKTTAVYMALDARGQDLSMAAFWSACDLGNLAGKAIATVAHPTLKSEKTGRPIKVPGSVPDLTEPAIVIPDTVTDLVLLGDSTSDPFITKNAMVRAAARFSRPGRTVRVAWAPEGVDFDDLLRAAKGDEAATDDALRRIADIIDSAPIGETSMPDAAPAFVDIDPATLAQAERKFGLEQLNAGLAQIRAAEGNDRMRVLSAIAKQVGQLVGAGAIVEAFAKASLKDAAVGAGLIGDIGVEPVKSAIAACLKLGKKSPHDMTEVRRAASAALGAPHKDGRPREAGGRMGFSPDMATLPSGDATMAKVRAPRERRGEDEKFSQSPSAVEAGAGGGDEKPPSSKFDIDDFNLSFAFVIWGGKAVVVNEQPSGPINDRVRLLSFDSVNQWFANKFTEVRGADGKVKPVTFATAWLRHPRRRQYDGVEFFPSSDDEQGTPRYLNLWRGFSVEPSEAGSCAKFKDHLRVNVCQEDEGLYRFLFGWLAHMVQRPRARAGIALVLRGGKGTGKTKVGEVVGSLFAPHYFLVDDARYLTGQFNAHMAACLLLQADEAMWAGDKAAEGRLKGLITSEMQMVEAKGIDPVRMRNFVHVIMTSNEDWVVPASGDERRFFVLDVGSRCQRNNTYFAEIDDELDRGGRERLLYELLAFDLENFNIYDVPQTKALLDQKIGSLGPIDEFWHSRLHDGALIHGDENWRAVVTRDDLYNEYLREVKSRNLGRARGSADFGKRIKKLVPNIRDTRPAMECEPGVVKRTRCYELPTLKECRESFEAHLGQPMKWPALHEDDQRLNPDDQGEPHDGDFAV